MLSHKKAKAPGVPGASSYSTSMRTSAVRLVSQTEFVVEAQEQLVDVSSIVRVP